MSDDLYALLREWKALEAAATEEPWSRHFFGLSGDPEPTSIVVHTGGFDWSDLVSEDSESAVAWMPGANLQSDDDAAFIVASRIIVPRLLAAVEAVLTLAEAWRYKGEYGDGPWQLGEGPDESGQALDDASSQLRAAVRAALIGGGDE